MKPNKDMTELGRLIAEAREAKGLSARRLEATSGLDHSFISKLEKATYQSVSAETLTTLARVLDLPPEDLFTLAGYKIPASLPSFGPYLRARYGGELPPGARAALTEVFETLRKQHHGSDQVDDEADLNEAPAGGRS